MRIRVARKPEDAYQHGNLREALIQAGLKLLGEGGVAGLSLRAAAQLAGVSHAAPYRHFRDKSSLLAAIAETGFRRLNERMLEEKARAASDLPDQLRAIGVGYVQFAIENPGYLRMMFGNIACADPEAVALREAASAAFMTLRDLVAKGVETGAFKAGDVDEIALAAWSGVHGLSMLAIDGALAGKVEGKAAVKTVTEAIGRWLYEGIGSPVASSPGKILSGSRSGG